MQQAPPQSPQRRRSMLPAVLLVGALVAATGFGLSHLAAPAEEDVITQAEIQQREQAFGSAAPLQMRPVTTDKATAAVDSMNLPVAEKDALRRDLGLPAAGTQPVKAAARPSPAVAVAQRQVKLVELYLWDTHAVDGDVVRVISGGFSRDVPLAKAPTPVYVPQNGAEAVQIMGVRDGGGGITLGIKAGDTSVLAPVLSAGQVISLRSQ